MGPFRPTGKTSHTYFFIVQPQKKQEFFDKYMTIKVPDCDKFLGGNLEDNEENNNSFQLVIDILWFFLWSPKLEKKAPNKIKIFENINDTVSRIMKVSPKIYISLNNSSVEA